MIQLDLPIIVEGKYDRQRLGELIDGTFIETGGFAIFRNREKLDMIRTLAAKTGIIILTDSDAAGFKIRHYLHSAIPKEQITDVFIPDIYGKERRKAVPSSEGKLGVEGMSPEILIQCLNRAGISTGDRSALPPKTNDSPATRADLFIWGLSGTDRASERRTVLLRTLGFPERMSTGTMLSVLNTLYSREELEALLETIFA